MQSVHQVIKSAVLFSALLFVSFTSSLFASENFDKVNLAGGELYYVSICASDPSVMYAAGLHSGVWVSKDTGNTWQETKFWAEYANGPGSLFAHPDSPSVVMASVCGLARSNDYGETWEKSQSFEYETQIRKIVYSPGDHSILYALVLVLEDSISALYTSNDGGIAWTKISTVTTKKMVTDLCITSDGTMFVSSLDEEISMFPKEATTGTIYKSIDTGATWTAINGINTAPWYMQAADSTVIAACAGENSQNSAIYVSRDNGTTFDTLIQSPDIGVGTFAFSLAVTPDGNSLYYFESSEYNEGYRLRKSTFTNTAWSTPASISGGTLNGDTIVGASGLAISATDPQIMIMSDNTEHGILKSTDAGVTWKVSHNGISAIQVYDGTKGPNGNMYILGRLSVFESSDSGKSWQRLYYSTSGGAYGTFDAGMIAANPDSTKSYIYAVDKEGVIASFDGGQQWSKVLAIPNGYAAAQSMAFRNDSPAIGYVALADLNTTGETSRKYIYKTTDYGQTWTNLDLSGMSIQSMAVDPFNPERVYLGLGEVAPWQSTSYAAGGLWVLTDKNGVASWTQLGLKDYIPTRIALDPQHPGIMFVSCIEELNNNNYAQLYVTTDSGSTWAKVVGDSTTTNPFAASAILDLEYSKPNFYFTSFGGIFQITNNGKSFIQIADSKDIGSVECIIAGSLYAGASSGFYKMKEGITSINPIPNSCTNHKMKLLVSQQIRRIWVKYEINNPSTVRIDLLNLRGQHISTLAQGLQQKGSYSILWDSQHMLSTGLYLLRAQIGKKTLSKQILFVK